MGTIRFTVLLVLAAAASTAAGLGSALLAVRASLTNDLTARNGPWVTPRNVSSPNETMYARAARVIASIGALRKEEALYFNATEDSAGNALSGKCSYRIEGRDPDARWWSITAYGTDRFLIPNPGNRYSVSKTNVVRAVDGSFSIELSTTASPQNWIATSPEGFDLTLRLYNPGATLAKDPLTAPLPAIVKGACR
jgi:hypothetical protein